MPNDQVACKNCLEFIKLDLVFGEPQKCTSLASELTQCHRMVLEVGDEEGKLVTKAKDRPNKSLIGRCREIGKGR